MAVSCTAAVVSIIFTGDVSLPLRRAIFGLDVPQSYAEWAASPQGLAVCRRHYRMLHRKDGVTLGYRKRNGMTVAYVKEEHY